jgi:hypothetical protein
MYCFITAPSGCSTNTVRADTGDFQPPRIWQEGSQRVPSGMALAILSGKNILQAHDLTRCIML